jgi:hypothetical protein
MAQTMGEIMFRGNIVMKGYLKNPTATEKAFEGGWFHTGDLAVMEPDRYVKIKDRSKDIIISGGENISSIEVEDALYRHPAVLACAVVARPDPKWGETPLAFVELKAGATATAAELVAHCRGAAGRLQGAARDPLRGDPQDQHRQDPEVPAARARGAKSDGKRSSSFAQPNPSDPSRSEADAPRSAIALEEAAMLTTARSPALLHDRRPRRGHPDAQPAAGASTRCPRPCWPRCRPNFDAWLADDPDGAGRGAGRGAGKAFCAGHDLKEMRAEPSLDYYEADCFASAAA